MKDYNKERQDIDNQIEQAERDISALNTHIRKLKEKKKALSVEEASFRSASLAGLHDLSAEFSSEMLVYDKSLINTGPRLRHGGKRKRGEDMEELSKMIESYIRSRNGLVKLEFINKLLEDNGVYLANPTSFMRSMTVRNRNIVKKARGYYGLRDQDC